MDLEALVPKDLFLVSKEGVGVRRAKGRISDRGRRWRDDGQAQGLVGTQRPTREFLHSSFSFVSVFPSRNTKVFGDAGECPPPLSLTETEMTQLAPLKVIHDGGCFNLTGAVMMALF